VGVTGYLDSNSVGITKRRLISRNGILAYPVAFLDTWKRYFGQAALLRFPNESANMFGGWLHDATGMTTSGAEPSRPVYRYFK
jgi:hypothetical protein